MNTSSQSNKNSQKIQIAIKKAIGSSNKALELLDKIDLLECSELLVQIDSASGSLESARTQILDHFLDTCIEENLNSKDKYKLKNQLVKLYKLTK
jgi:DNA-binding FrmR family transcriptional regulator